MSIREKIKAWNPILNYPDPYRGYEPPSDLDVIEFRKIELSPKFKNKIKSIREEHNIRLTDADWCIDQLEQVDSPLDQVKLVGEKMDDEIDNFLTELALSSVWYRTLWIYIMSDQVILFSTEVVGIKWARVGKGLGELVDDFMQEGILLYIPRLINQGKLWEDIRVDYDNMAATLKQQLKVKNKTVVNAERIAELYFNGGLELEAIAEQLSEDEAKEGSTEVFDYHRVRGLFESYIEAIGINFTLRN